MQTDISFKLLKVHLRKQLINPNNNNYNLIQSKMGKVPEQTFLNRESTDG